MTNTATHIIFNGELYRSDDKLFECSNRAFSYGDGLFETMLSYSTTVEHLDRHLDRLYRGMEVIGLIPHEKLSKSLLERDIQRLLNRDKLFGTIRIRLTAFRDQGGLYTPTSDSSSYIVSTQALETPKYELNQKGLVLDIFPNMQKQFSILSPFKTCNSLLYVLAGKYAKNNGLNEAIITDCNGNILETTASNIFIVKDKTIFTPPISDGCVDGIMRSVICKLIEESEFTLNNIDHLSIDDLLKADEIFITNAVRGIQWVVAFRDRRYFNKVSKILANKLKVES